jgi:3-phenylpropionate/cinnamic acid dioxygenase small subunit
VNWASEPDAREAIQQLIRLETACLNKGDLEGWISLFTDDGYYWMPLEEEHSDPEKHDSLIYDNRALMEMRRHNMASPLAPSMELDIRSVRILSDIEIQSVDGADNVVDVTAFVIAVIYQQQKHTYGGRVSYRLVNADDGLKIRVKRVDLLDADAPLDCIMGYI